MSLKSAIKLFLILIISCFISMNVVGAVTAKQGVGGYYKKRDSGKCAAYPDIKININNPKSSANVTYAYCFEEGTDYTVPTSSTVDYKPCIGNYPDYMWLNYIPEYSQCEVHAAAYMGMTSIGGENETTFWAAQRIVNGKLFYKYKNGDNCSELIEDEYQELLNRARDYCTPIDLDGVTVNVGEPKTITLDAKIAGYTLGTHSDNLTVTKSGRTITITANSAGNGTINFYSGGAEPVKVFCEYDKPSQNLMVSLSLPYMSTTMSVTVNSIQGYATLTKVDSSNSNTKLQGAKFKFCTNEAMTANCLDYTTGDNGTFTTSSYTLPQTLYYKEIEAPDYYNIDDASVKSITLVEGNTPITASDTRKTATATLTKVDSSNSNTKLQGARFNVCTDAAMTNCREYTTLGTGTFTTQSYTLPQTLYIKETQAPSGYNMDTQTHTITLSENSNNNKITVSNTKIESAITIMKVDSSNASVLLSGADFKVCTNQAMTSNCRTYTTTDGTFTTSSYTLPQTLYYREIKAPDKYNIDDSEVHSVTLTENNTEIRVTNTKKRGYLVINKIDQNHSNIKLSGAVFKVCTNREMTSNCEPITTDANGVARTPNTYPVDTALYYEEITAPTGYRIITASGNIVINNEGENSITVGNIQQHKVKIKKVDKDFPSTLLSGAKFKVCLNEEMTQGCLTDLLVTGSNGQTQEIGPYDEGTVLWVQEVLAPENYNIDQPAPQRIVVGTQDVIKSFTDTMKQARLKIIKKDSENTDILLGGVKFRVCTSENMNDVTNCVDYITNALGEITTKYYPINTTLYYKEVETLSNYYIDDNTYSIKLDSETTIPKVVTNVMKKGYLKIVKSSIDKTPIEGTVFQIGTNLNGERGVGWDFYYTDENGEITLPAVPIGTTYFYREISASQGYIYEEISGVISIENNLNTNEEFENKIEITNDYVEGSLKIYKVSNKYYPLKGVKFKIGLNLDGREGKDWNYYYTDDSGEIFVEGLYLNIEGDTVYKVKEVETLPGYELDTEVHELVLNADYTNNANFASILIKNNEVVKLKEVKIYKLDKESKEPIKGAKIKVYTMEGKLYREIVTDEKGEAQIEVEEGAYYFEEVETPTGYESVSGKIKFVYKNSDNELTALSIDSNSEEFTEIIIYNKLKNVKTGAFDVIIPFMTSLVAAFGIFMFIRKHQKLV